MNINFYPVGFTVTLLFFYIRNISDHPFKLRLVNILFNLFFKNGILLKTNDGVKLKIQPKDWISYQIITNGTYESRSLKLILRNINSEDVFIDVGANFGLFTCMIRGIKKAEVHCFEPGAEVFPSLLNNIKLNNFSNITVNHFALSETKAIHNFSIDWLENLGSAKITASDATSPIINYNILSTDLATYINDIVKSDIKFIKIDVEGHESQVLRGLNECLRYAIYNILIEYKPDSKQNSELFKVIKDLGYSVHDIFGRSIDLPIATSTDIPESNLWLKKT